MGILSDFFIADPSACRSYGGGDDFDSTDKCQFKGLTALQGAQFLAALRGGHFAVEMIREFELVTPDDADDWTVSVPQDMVEALARIRMDEIVAVADQFAQVTSEELGWSRDEFVPIVTELTALSRRAIETNKQMYLWNCL